jgi:hypothetical protein
MDKKSEPAPAVRRADPRYAIDIPAKFVIDESEPHDVRLINFSRHGFRVTFPQRLPAGHAVRLEVDGWPRLAGKVMWCDSGRIGCMIDTPPSETVYAMMCAAAEGRDRDEV